MIIRTHKFNSIRMKGTYRDALQTFRNEINRQKESRLGGEHQEG